jgi:hypothetical protein
VTPQATATSPSKLNSQHPASGPEHQVRVLGWRRFEEEWRLVFNLMPLDENGPRKGPTDWLTGECDTCGRWLRWK